MRLFWPGINIISYPPFLSACQPASSARWFALHGLDLALALLHCTALLVFAPYELNGGRRCCGLPLIVILHQNPALAFAPEVKNWEW